MRIGFLGLGKLGLPVALAIESKGHQVVGYDISPNVKKILETRRLPYREQGAQGLLDKTNIRFASIPEVVEFSELIFVPIQTPHDPLFEGITPLPKERVDFDYTYLKEGVKTLSQEIARQGKDKIVIIISTVLPGTIEREIKPLLNEHVKLCYNPFFIAMGTTINDFLNPEIVLFGVDDKQAAEKAKEFYRTIHNSPFFETTIRNAEAIKVFYNTFISTKIGFANTIMEIAHKLGADSDVIIDALSMCHDRIISPKYLRGGLGDGGNCHCRDNIALSYVARKYNLSYDWFEAVMLGREKQTGWFADLIQEHGKGMQKVILGTAYKPETNLTYGSPALLLKNILESRGEQVITYDPYVDGETSKLPQTAALFFIGTKHPEFTSYNFPEGSVVIDPFRYIPNGKKGVEIIWIGKGSN